MLKKLLKLFMLTFILTVPGCQNEHASTKDNNWVVLYFYLEDKQIEVFNERDSITLNIIKYKDTIVNNSRTWQKIKATIEKKSVTKEEKDSLFNWALKLTSKPVSPTRFCTDYVGKLKVVISHSDKVKQSCEYTSICDWKSLSLETKKIDELLKYKFGEKK